MRIPLIILFVLTSTFAAIAQKAIVNVDAVKLRSLPKERAKAIASLPKGMQISIIAGENGWLHVNTPRGAGWLPEASVTMEPKTEISKLGYGRSYAEQKPKIIYGRCKDDTFVDVDNKKDACADHGGIALWYADDLAGHYIPGQEVVGLGMPINDFTYVCKFGFAGDSSTTMNDVDAPETISFSLISTPSRRRDCIGVFIFQYGRLGRIDRTTVYQ